MRELRAAATRAVPAIGNRTVWMLSSTAEGGGVAELLQSGVSFLRQVGVRVQWAVIVPEDARFFELTKRIHNLLHGAGTPDLSVDDVALYESVSRHLADELRGFVRPEDVVYAHDPQPLGVGAVLARDQHCQSIWRCHIGLAEHTPATRAAWTFLRPWAEVYDRAIFSLPEYIPSFLSNRATVIYPGINPLTEKNRELSTHTLTGTLVSAKLAGAPGSTINGSFVAPASRLQPGGSLAPATQPDDLELLYHPIVLQVSRWDRLKGFAPLLEGFARLKRERRQRQQSARHGEVLDLVRLVLAGPDPAGVKDDPEAHLVMEEIGRLWLGLEEDVRRDVALVTLPTTNPRENALMVNALQRCATIVAQNSLQEGFGLTVTEAMWKVCPILGSAVGGIRAQVRDGEDGRLVRNPQDTEEIATTLGEMLVDEHAWDIWGRNAQDRVTEHALVFTQVRRELETIAQVVEAGRTSPPPPVS